MDFNRFRKAIKELDKMLTHLDKKEYAEKADGISLTIYPDHTCDIRPIGWHSKDFDSIEEFVVYMENKEWKKEFE